LDPLAKLLLSYDKTWNKPIGLYNRQLFTYNGYSTCRIEVSFYGNQLKSIETYKSIIETLYPGREIIEDKYKKKAGKLTHLPCFSDVKVGDYFRTLFEGEKKFGRFIFLEELNDDKAKFTFVRFINKISSTKQKLIGFEITDKKEKIL